MVDIHQTLTDGGKARIDLLRYSVMSITMEPLFLFLASEYRLRPTHKSALALFDVFCATQSRARLAAYELLPPRELGLSAEIAQIRGRWTALQSPPPEEEDESPRSVAPWPSRVLFDKLVQGLRSDASGRLAAVSTGYDPQLTPQENLPGGKMSAIQRQFVDQVWLPFARPRLVDAGYWQISAIG